MAREVIAKTRLGKTRAPGMSRASKFLSTLACVSAVLLASPVSAYEPIHGHGPLMGIAYDQYTNCSGRQEISSISGAKKRLQQGTVAMDTGLGGIELQRVNANGTVELESASINFFQKLGIRGSSVFSVLNRPLNWHFNSLRLNGASSRIGLIEVSGDRLFSGLYGGVYKNKTPLKQLLFVGGMGHMIEDASVPAHVAPVYHGPKQTAIIAPFLYPKIAAYMAEENRISHEHNGAIKDAIDEYPLDHVRVASAVRAGELCQTIDKYNYEPFFLNRLAAIDTADAMEQMIPGCPGVTWHAFWHAPEVNSYFGKHNTKSGKHINPLFGEAGVMLAANGASCVFSQDDSRYADFVFERHVQAVSYDMKLLRWADRLIN